MPTERNIENEEAARASASGVRREARETSGAHVKPEERPHLLEDARDDSTGVSAENRSLLQRLVPGTIVDNKYRVDAVIGRGAMGVVVAATHVHLKERAALKFLHARKTTVTTDFHARFQREAQVSARLKNEHVTRVIDVGVWEGDAPYMVMDHLEGADLKKVLKQHGPLPVEVALELVIQVCEGMAEAHALGIVHRDLKPSNLFITKRTDGSDLLKILDFGISKVDDGEEEEELTQAGVVLGSPKYMAPEQLFGSATVDTRADIWSIGAIFYEMLAGKPPYDASTLPKMYAALASEKPPPSLHMIREDVPESLELALSGCFARDRENRLSNVAELAGALLDAVEAPFAAAVKQKIQAMLDPKAGRDGLTSSGPRMLGTGAYSVLASSIMTASSQSMRAPKIAAPDVPITVEAPAPKRRWAAIGGALAGAAVTAALVLFATSRGRDAGSTPAMMTTTSAAALTATAAVTATGAGAEAEAGAGAGAGAGARSGTFTGTGTFTGGERRPVAHYTYRPAPKPAPAPPPQPVQSAPIVAAPAPAPAPTPAASKPKVNPLEDRQ